MSIRTSRGRSTNFQRTASTSPDPALLRVVAYLVPITAALGPWISLNPGREGQVTAFRGLAVLVVLLGVVERLRSTTHTSRIGLYWTTFTALFALQTVRFMRSGVLDETFGGRRQLFGMATAIAAAYGFYLLLTAHPTLARPALRGFTHAFTAFVVVACLEALTGRHPTELVGNPWKFPLRSPAATFNNPNDLACFMLLGLAATLIMLRQRTDLTAQALRLLSFSATLLIALLSASRGALLGAFLIGFVHLIVHRAWRFPVAVLAIAGIYPMSLLQSYLAGDAAQANSDDLRSILSRYCWDMFLTNPWLGTGPARFQDYYSNVTGYPVELAIPPHNSLLELVAEYGLLVGAPLLVTIILTLRVAMSGWSRLAPSLASSATAAPIGSRASIDANSLDQSGAQYPSYRLGLEWLVALILSSIVPSSVLASPWWWAWVGLIIAIASNTYRTVDAAKPGTRGTNRSASNPRR